MSLTRSVILVALALLGGQAVVGAAGSVIALWGLTAAAVALAALALAPRLAARIAPAARSVAALGACLALAMQAHLWWQVTAALGLVAFFGLTRAVPALRVDRSAPSGPTWRARGRVPLGWTALVGGVTPLALVLWLVIARPDLGDVVGAYVPDLPLAVLLLGAALIAVINAALEEIIWRGVLQGRLAAAFAPAWTILLQAVSFGVAHAHGVPRGLVGVGLAGAWAVMLGLLRRHAGGLLAPVLAHVVADLTIGAIILGLAR